MIPNRLFFLSDKKRELFWHKYQPLYTEIIPQIAYKTQDYNAIKWAYNAALLSKGILLNSSLSVDQLFNHIKDDSLKSTYTNYISITKQIQETKEIIGDIKIDSLRQISEMLKNKLMTNPYLQLYSTLLLLKWEQVYECIKEKEVAIEFVNYTLENNDKMYLALVLQHGENSPQLIPLFKESELPIRSSYPVVDEKLAYNLIWSKLQSHLKGAKTIFFSPIGILHRIALEYLQDEDGLPVNWHYNIYRLSSTRELISAKESVRDTLICTFWGDFNYTYETKKYKYDKKNNHMERDLRGAIVNDVAHLPMTLAEINSICKNASINGHKYKVYMGDQGTELQFRSISNTNIDIIHIATHGFYYPFNDSSAISNEDEMLKRTGIIMAGFNDTQNNVHIDHTNDGVLTAQEISHLDFSSTDLITIAACQTALGDITSDGVYGLQRAFKKAGVQSELVSLWNIDDEATSFFMKSFYRYYFESKNKSQSLRFAQQALTQYKEGKYNNKKNWSAFVLIDGFNSRNINKAENIKTEINKLRMKDIKFRKAKAELESLDQIINEESLNTIPKFAVR